MYWSKAFIPTLKENPQEAESLSHKLLLRAGLARMLMAGAYSYLPLGLRVLENIQKIIRQEMNACGASELLLPALQPLELWQKTGRDKDIGEVMFKFIDRRKRNVVLGPTHEEIITDLIKSQISSYRQLPLVLYQIQTKFRDEIRPRNGLIRACEFIMKDAYSFDQDQAGLDKNYQLMYEAYKRIFLRCGLKTLITEADSGVMGGKESHEFMVPAAAGEDLVLVCKKCKQTKAFNADSLLCPKCNFEMDQVNTIEVGHIFKLGTKYSQALEANFADAKGVLKPIIMGCYGIGVSRLVSAIIEQNNDAQGIIWPPEVTPYQVLVLPLDVANSQIMQEAVALHDQLAGLGFTVLLDDRDERAGVKFKDADLLGIPIQVVISRNSLVDQSIEIKVRSTKEKIIKPRLQAIEQISKSLLLYRKAVMDKENIKQELELLFEQKITALGFELVDVVCRPEGGNLFLKILADRLGGGINLDECAQISRKISQALDEKDIIASRYILEVSSPGLDRLLKKQRDFLRSLNKEAVFFLNDLVSGKCQWQGIINKVDQSAVYLQAAGKILEIPLVKINKAQLVI